MPPESDDLILRFLERIESGLADLKRDVAAGFKDHEQRIRALEDERRDRDAVASAHRENRVIVLNGWQRIAALVTAVGGLLSMAKVLGIV